MHKHSFRSYLCLEPETTDPSEMSQRCTFFKIKFFDEDCRTVVLFIPRSPRAIHVVSWGKCLLHYEWQNTPQTFLYVTRVSLTTKQFTIWRANNSHPLKASAYLKLDLLTDNTLQSSHVLISIAFYTWIYIYFTELPSPERNVTKIWHAKHRDANQPGKNVFIDNYETLVRNWITVNILTLLIALCLALSKFWHKSWTVLDIYILIILRWKQLWSCERK